MTDLMAGEIVAALLLLIGVITLIALQGKDNPGPDVGVDIVDCGMVHDCDGCDECGAPMVIAEDTCPVCEGEGAIGDVDWWEMCFLCHGAEAS